VKKRMSDLLLQDQTLQVLKNFSIVNSQVYFKKGNKLQVVAPGDNILAEARFTGAEEFQHEFCIYDISKLLAILSVMNGNKKIEYEEAQMVIKSGAKSSVVYEFAAPEAIKKAPYITMPQPDPFDKLIDFDVNTFIKAISILELQTVSFEPKKDHYRVFGSKKTSKNRYDIEVPVEGEIRNTSTTTVDIEKFKLYPCNKYDVVVSEQLIRLDAKLEDTSTVEVSYWVAAND
jgi:hypothetical protein